MGAKVIGLACVDLLTGIRDKQGVTDIERWRAANAEAMARGHGRLFTPSELMRLAEQRTIDSPKFGKGGAS